MTEASGGLETIFVLPWMMPKLFHSSTAEHTDLWSHWLLFGGFSRWQLLVHKPFLHHFECTQESAQQGFPQSFHKCAFSN